MEKVAKGEGSLVAAAALPAMDAPVAAAAAGAPVPVAAPATAPSAFPAMKGALRVEARAARKALPPGERAAADRAIAAAVRALPEFAAAPVVFSYLAFGSEVETRPIIEAAWAAGKSVALPRCVEGSRALAWYLVEDFAALEPSALGMLEPRPDPSRLVDPAAAPKDALALVPGLRFDRHGYRLGYGGGYYDCFLAGVDGAASRPHDAAAGSDGRGAFPGKAVGLARAPMVVERLEPVEPHDRPVDLLVTDREVLRFS